MLNNYKCPKCSSKSALLRFDLIFKEHFECSKCDALLTVEYRWNNRLMVYGCLILTYSSGWFWITGDSIFSNIQAVAVVTFCTWFNAHFSKLVESKAQAEGDDFWSS